MDELNPNSKKAKRLESKKKKAAAFLALLGHTVKPEMMDTGCSETVFLVPDGEPDDALLEMRKAVREQKRKNKIVKEYNMQAMMTDTECNEAKSPELDKGPLNDDVLAEMKKIVRERKKQAMQKPKVFLALEAMLPFRPIPGESVKEEELPPLYAMDLQQLLLYGVQGNSASYKPRWCKLLRVGKVSSVVLLMLEGISYSDYEKNKSNFPFISETFVSYVEMVCPKQYMHTLDRELCNVPLSVSQLKKVNVRVPKSIRDKVAAKIAQPVGKADTEKFSRTCLLLSTYQMMLEGYPLPVHTNIGRYRDFVFTKDKYTTVTANSPIFAVDCEMCTTSAKKNELTRVSIVSEKGEVIFDTLVKPENEIINYLTRFSGITKQMLDPVTTSLEDVQREIRNILPPDAILCGQSLNGDLMALKMFHPYVIDTSVIFNMSGNRGVKAGLRKLSQFFLGRSIQDSKDGHNSTEDAAASLDLVKLKLTKGLEFGDATLSGVYFPDIHTYFMAEENSTAGVIENVERDHWEDVQPVLRKSENSSQSSDALKICKTSCGHAQTLSSVTDKESRCSVSIHKKAKHNARNFSVGFSDAHSDTLDLKVSSSSSASSVDESDDGGGTKPDHENGEPCTKKRKLSEPSETTSDPSLGIVEPGSSNGGGENPESHTSDLEGCGNNVITKCKDFSFASTTELVELQKQCLFSQENSVHISHSFFRLVYDAGRSGCVIDRQAVINKYQTEPVETVVVASDTEARRAAKTKVQSKEFVWAHFHGYSDEMEQATQERKEKLMRKLDNRVRSVMKYVKPNALVAVVMTGRDSDEIPHNMATFITTT